MPLAASRALSRKRLLLPRRFLQIPLRAPREWGGGFDRLGRDLFAEYVLEDRAVHVFDLRHRVGGQDLVDAALVADVPAAAGLIVAVRGGPGGAAGAEPALGGVRLAQV